MQPKPAGYEFSEPQNQKVSRLVRLMRVFAYSLFGAGCLQALALVAFTSRGLTEGWTGIPWPSLLVLTLGGIAAMYLGLGLLEASRSFVQIVATVGSDIGHLMAALDRLRLLFWVTGFLLWTLVLLLIGVTGLGLWNL